MTNNNFTVKILDIIYPKELESNNCLFIVMEYVHADLKKIINSVPETVLNEQHIIIIVYNALCCLNFIHTANIMHRDIKPSNLLID